MEACYNQKKNLVLYAYGELDSSAGEKIKNHLEICSSCRTEYQQLIKMLGDIKDTVMLPELSPKQVNSLVTNINWKLRGRTKDKWWRQFTESWSSRMIPAVATACILIIAAGVIGYVKINENNELSTSSGQQQAEIMLNDKDLEIVQNLEFLKEMDAIRKLSQVVGVNMEINSHGESEDETRGMRRDANRKYFV